MEVREELKEIIEKAKEAAIAAGELPEGDYAAVQRLEVPKSKEFGDYSTNGLCSGRERLTKRRA